MLVRQLKVQAECILHQAQALVKRLHAAEKQGVDFVIQNFCVFDVFFVSRCRSFFRQK